MAHNEGSWSRYHDPPVSSAYPRTSTGSGKTFLPAISPPISTWSGDSGYHSAQAIKPYGRHLTTEEEDVAWDYVEHAKNCSTCSDPKTNLQNGGRLCPIGDTAVHNVLTCFRYDPHGRVKAKCDGQHVQLGQQFGPIRVLLGAIKQNHYSINRSQIPSPADRYMHPARAKQLPNINTHSNSPSQKALTRPTYSTSAQFGTDLDDTTSTNGQRAYKAAISQGNPESPGFSSPKLKPATYSMSTYYTKANYAEDYRRSVEKANLDHKEKHDRRQKRLRSHDTVQEAEHSEVEDPTHNGRKGRLQHRLLHKNASTMSRRAASDVDSLTPSSTSSGVSVSDALPSPRRDTSNATVAMTVSTSKRDLNPYVEDYDSDESDRPFLGPSYRVSFPERDMPLKSIETDPPSVVVSAKSVSTPRRTSNRIQKNEESLSSLGESDTTDNDSNESISSDTECILRRTFDSVKKSLLEGLINHLEDEALDASSGSNSHKRARESSSASSSQLSERPQRKRARGSDRDPGDEGDNSDNDDNDSDENRPPRDNGKSGPFGLPYRRLKCPFYQREPEKHSRAACRGEGFSDMAKLKDHIKRVHTQPMRCFRCWKVMKSDDEFAAHLRETNCEKLPEPSDNRIPYRILKALDFKKKPYVHVKNTEEKWRMLYSTLFPDDEQIPSPYDQHCFSPKLERILHEAIEEELTRELEAELAPILQRIKRRIPAIIQRCKLKFFPGGGSPADDAGRSQESLDTNIQIDQELNSSQPVLKISTEPHLRFNELSPVSGSTPNQGRSTAGERFSPLSSSSNGFQNSRHGSSPESVFDRRVTPLSQVQSNQLSNTYEDIASIPNQPSALSNQSGLFPHLDLDTSMRAGGVMLPYSNEAEPQACQAGRLYNLPGDLQCEYCHGYFPLTPWFFDNHTRQCKREHSSGASDPNMNADTSMWTLESALHDTSHIQLPYTQQQLDFDYPTDSYNLDELFK